MPRLVSQRLNLASRAEAKILRQISNPISISQIAPGTNSIDYYMIKLMPKKMPQNRRFLLISFALLVVVFVITLVIFRNYRTNVDSILQLRRATVETGTVQQLVIASGKLEAVNSAQINSNTNGEVSEILFEVGDGVNSGDVIARVEAVDQFGQTSTQDVTTPISGEVVAVLVDRGDSVLATQSPLMLVADFSELRVRASVSETDQLKLAVGQTGRLDIDPADIEDLEIQVAEISRVPLTGVQASGSSISEYEVILTGDFPSDLPLGLSADIEIVVEEKTNVLVVDDAYVFRLDGKNFVKVIESSGNDQVSLTDVEVELGLEGETSVEISSGVEEGTEIVLPTDEIRAQRGTPSLFGGN